MGTRTSAAPTWTSRSSSSGRSVPGRTGTVTEAEHLEVRIAPGIEDGTALRIPGRGMPAPDGHGVPGDMLVVVRAGPHPTLVRRGPHLWHVEAVDVPDAVLGTTRRIATLDGDLTVTIPPGTQPGTTLRIPGRGLPRLDGGGRGDLLIAVEVRIPEQLTDRERRLWEELAAESRAERAQEPGRPGS